MSGTKGYVEHVAIHVRNIGWYVKYFGEVFGMEPYRTDEQDGKVKQVWLHGGIQLTSVSSFEVGEPEKQGITHIGIVVEDVKSAIEESYFRGVKPVVDKKDWVWLPDGVPLEIKRGKGSSVAEVLAVNPR
ncbi:MAG: VOC family protein [Synergistaceae bacterium]|jgi:extradiol dioxygenase family protein|nr:VOC family protein [Synergistaceae bacterium]